MKTIQKLFSNIKRYGRKVGSSPGITGLPGPLDNMVEMWDPVLGPRDPQDLQHIWELQDHWTPTTSGSHRLPLDLWTFGKLPLSFEIQNLNTQL